MKATVLYPDPSKVGTDRLRDIMGGFWHGPEPLANPPSYEEIELGYHPVLEMEGVALRYQDDPLLRNYDRAADFIFRGLQAGEQSQVAAWVDMVFRESHRAGIGHTSMSVGDAIRFEDGKVLVCAPTGWVEPCQGTDLPRRPSASS